ncbi:MAG: DNA mismatch repair endonuclease MutL [candidate division Zixibacteria bacterium]|nr:DNA mismatch repair endonuclease MutL [candidate division Zixibacteria bacterium]
MHFSTGDKPKIKVLDETLINKIAAGEVIERPASVVKELVENALDAGAENISIELEEGGLRLIAIHDDGVGMLGEDLELAFTRHATSKLAKADDLFNILSFGFRGEALPSIASVAHVKAISRVKERDSGSEIEIDGGRVKGLKATGCPVGTSIIVSNLFYNTPARRKFLKSPRSELSRITDLVTSYAVGNFDVGFKISHNGRELYNFPPAAKLYERIIAIYGTDDIEKFLPLPGTDEGMFNQPGSILGYITHPVMAKSRSNETRFFVNFRPIMSRTLLAALRAGYHDKLAPNLYPPTAIFFNILPRDIDVNVHPAKTEIRFKNESELFPKLKRLVEHALKSGGVLTELSLNTDEAKPSGNGTQFIHAKRGNDFSKRTDMQESLYKGGFKEYGESSETAPSRESDIEKDGVDIHSGIEKPHESTEQRMWQFMDSFIVVPLKNSMLFIDQHNAHERILFEAAMENLDSGKGATQQMLFPISIDLTPGEFAIWNEYSEVLNRLGFETSEFGGHSILISGIPAEMDDKAPESALRRILDDFQEGGEFKDDPFKSIAASFACHAAIKAGQKLQYEEMEQIFNKLFACQEFNLCPHGRPIIARLTSQEVEKKFNRHVPIRD